MAQVKKVPAIRFKGFSEIWEEAPLGEVVDFFSGLTYSPKDVVGDNGTFVLRSSNVKNGEIVNADDVFVNSEVVNCDNVKEGDIAVVVRNGSRSLIGKHAQIKRKMKNTVIGAFMTGIRSEQPNFTNALLDTDQFNKEVEKNLGATINQITTGAFKRMSFCFPDADEQTQIGSYFQHLDKLISLHQTKVNKLTNLKKAMLEKMFPKKGADVPEIRFKGFAGAWEEKRLGDVVECYSGGTPLVEQTEFYGGDIPFIRSAEINSNSTELYLTEKGLKNSSAKLVKSGDILYALYGATSGEVGRSRINGAINQAILTIIPSANYDAEFIMQLLRKLKLKIIGTFLQGGQGNLSGAIIKDLNILFPLLSEQQKIGAYFQNLDKTITLHQTELEKLNNLKKACLEKMFV